MLFFVIITTTIMVTITTTTTTTTTTTIISIIITTIIIVFVVIIIVITSTAIFITTIIIMINNLTSACGAKASVVVHVRDAVFAQICVLLAHIKALHNDRRNLPVSLTAGARAWTNDALVVIVDSGDKATSTQ